MVLCPRPMGSRGCHRHEGVGRAAPATMARNRQRRLSWPVSGGGRAAAGAERRGPALVASPGRGAGRAPRRPSPCAFPDSVPRGGARETFLSPCETQARAAPHACSVNPDAAGSRTPQRGRTSPRAGWQGARSGARAAASPPPSATRRALPRANRPTPATFTSLLSCSLLLHCLCRTCTTHRRESDFSQQEGHCVSSLSLSHPVGMREGPTAAVQDANVIARWPRPDASKGILEGAPEGVGAILGHATVATTRGRTCGSRREEGEWPGEAPRRPSPVLGGALGGSPHVVSEDCMATVSSCPVCVLHDELKATEGQCT